MQLGFQAGAAGGAIGIGLVLVQFGDGQQRFEQFVDAFAGGGAGFDDFGFAAPFARQQFVGRQLLVGPLHVGAGQVDLVQRDDDGDIGGLGVADGLFRLRHDAVFGRNHQDGDVGDIGAAGAHLGERFVARRIDEGDRPAVLLDAVRADVLSDAALFVRGHVDADDSIQAATFCRGPRGRGT